MREWARHDRSRKGALYRFLLRTDPRFTSALSDDDIGDLVPYFDRRYRERLHMEGLDWILKNAPRHVKLWFTAVQIGIARKNYRLERRGGRV